jgi:molybdopterin/thiamine biosynthesis adenylyltransferase
LGSPIALLLAQAGLGELYLIDPELVELGNLVRHITGLEDLGRPKVEAVEDKLQSVNPHILVNMIPERLGGSPGNYLADHHFLDEFEDLCRSVDLIIVALGEDWIHHLINRIAVECMTPAMFTWVTNGAQGGEVFLSLDESACYECLVYSSDLLPHPNALDNEPVFPMGCGFPTFQRANHDINVTAGHAARIAVTALLGDYPTYNHLVCNNSGLPEPSPSIYTTDLSRSPECTTCRTKSPAIG